ncbi:hypothetical protein E2C01_074524 [Portunus trituberculatus]|uniref:Uncharacterized protein n=1 Tax=Portunus trituberculatus TaxID=210409 RepID=A0A5B7ICC2_PORTR|nr:hypothetical protein [Portunus trituberculatus]
MRGNERELTLNIVAEEGKGVPHKSHMSSESFYGSLASEGHRRGWNPRRSCDVQPLGSSKCLATDLSSLSSL